MYATIIKYDMHAFATSHERGQAGRVLATLLSEIPGFVAFIAFDVDADAGRVIAVCIFEDLGAIHLAGQIIGGWQQERHGTVGTCMQRLGTGAVIAQKGL